jgi:hypothetical protein
MATQRGGRDSYESFRTSQSSSYDQDNDPGGHTLFHVPRSRWARFSFYNPIMKVHEHIPQRLGYHAATKSAFGH